MVAGTPNANGLISLLPSFGLHNRLVSFGRISDRMNWLANAIDHRYALVVRKISTKLVLLCRCTCLVIFPTAVPTVGQGMAINQTMSTLLHRVCAIRLVGLYYRSRTSCHWRKYPNALQIPFVCTWHASKSLVLLRDDLVLCALSTRWLTRLNSVR